MTYDKPTVGERTVWALEDAWYFVWHSVYRAVDWVGRGFEDKVDRTLKRPTAEPSSFLEWFHGGCGASSAPRTSYFDMVDMGVREEQNQNNSESGLENKADEGKK